MTCYCDRTIFITILSGVATQFISIQHCSYVGSIGHVILLSFLCVFTLFPAQSKGAILLNQ